MNAEKQDTEYTSRLPNANQLAIQRRTNDLPSMVRMTDQDRERLVQILDEALALLEDISSSLDPNRQWGPSEASEDSSNQEEQWSSACAKAVPEYLDLSLEK